MGKIDRELDFQKKIKSFTFLLLQLVLDLSQTYPGQTSVTEQQTM